MADVDKRAPASRTISFKQLVDKYNQGQPKAEEAYTFSNGRYSRTFVERQPGPLYRS